MFRWLLLSLALSLGAMSLLTWLKAPTLSTWRAAILAGEYGHWLAPVCLLAAAGAWATSRQAAGPVTWLTMGLFLGAAVSFARPAWRAVQVASQVNAQFARYFPGAVNPPGVEIGRAHV